MSVGTNGCFWDTIVQRENNTRPLMCLHSFLIIAISMTHMSNAFYSTSVPITAEMGLIFFYPQFTTWAEKNTSNQQCSYCSGGVSSQVSYKPAHNRAIASSPREPEPLHLFPLFSNEGYLQSSAPHTCNTEEKAAMLMVNPLMYLCV